MYILINSLVKSKNTNFASYYAENENLWQSSLDKLVETIAGIDN